MSQMSSSLGLRIGDGQAVQQALTDDADLDEHVIAVELGLDRVAVALRLVMQILITAVAGQRRHALHPEVAGEHATPMRWFAPPVFPSQPVRVTAPCMPISGENGPGKKSDLAARARTSSMLRGAMSRRRSASVIRVHGVIFGRASPSAAPVPAR